jgi:hypothetical protein
MRPRSGWGVWAVAASGSARTVIAASAMAGMIIRRMSFLLFATADGRALAAIVSVDTRKRT